MNKKPSIKLVADLSRDNFSPLNMRSIWFALISTTMYLFVYREVVIRHVIFQLSGILYFAVSIWLWNHRRDEFNSKYFNTILFSVEFGFIQYLAMYLLVTIPMIPSFSSVFTWNFVGLAASGYILSGVTGIWTSISICLISNFVLIVAYTFTRKITCVGTFNNQAISMVYDNFDNMSINANSTVVFKQNKQIHRKQSFNFELPCDGQLFICILTIKKHIFRCKTSIKLTIDDKIIFYDFSDWLEGMDLFEVFIAVSAFYISYGLLTLLLTPIAPKPPTGSNEIFLCTLLIIQYLLAIYISGLAANAFKKILKT